MNQQSIQGPGTALKFGGPWSGEMHAAPDVLDKVQTYPVPEDVKEEQAFIDLEFGRTFVPHRAQCLCPLCHPVKKEHT